MPTLQDLIAQREAIEKQIAEMRQLERSDAISKTRALIEEYELTQHDLFGSRRTVVKEKTTGKVAAKYRDPTSGATWTGRGKAPRWIANKDRTQFGI